MIFGFVIFFIFYFFLIFFKWYKFNILVQCCIFIFKGIESKQVEYVDLTKDNILYNDGDISFIDFYDAKYGESVIDISILIALFFVSSKTGVDLDGIRYFVDSYYGDDVDLKTKESCFIKQCALKWIDYTLENNEFESSLIENFELKKKLIKEYL